MKIYFQIYISVLNKTLFWIEMHLYVYEINNPKYICIPSKHTTIIYSTYVCGRACNTQELEYQAVLESLFSETFDLQVTVNRRKHKYLRWKEQTSYYFNQKHGISKQCLIQKILLYALEWELCSFIQKNTANQRA